MQEQPKPDRSSRNKNILVAVTIFTLVTFNLMQLYVREMHEKEQKEIYVSKQRELVGTYHKLDSISGELQSRIDALRGLGGRVDSLISIRNQVEQEKYALRQAKDLAEARYQEILSRVEDYKILLDEKEAEIKELKKDYEVLVAEYGTLKNEVNRLEGEKGELADQVREAAEALSLTGIKLFSVQKDGKREGGPTFKAKKIDRLLINVSIASNPVADKEQKDLYVSIIGPNGQQLSNEQAKTFRFQDRDIFYATKKEFMYQPMLGKNLELVYQRNSGFNPGEYQLEIYLDGRRLGAESFVVE